MIYALIAIVGIVVVAWILHAFGKLFKAHDDLQDR
jgi:hypothetical protein